MDRYQTIGHEIPRIDGPEKVTGKTQYAVDISVPDMLWARALRSPHAHARIKSIDVSKAIALPGVRCVITGNDVKGILYGRRLRDIPVLAQGKTRFIGERVAAVAADTEEIAQRAVDMIEVDYEELPSVFDPGEAILANAPIIHPDLKTYEGMTIPVQNISNVFATESLDRGDIERGFKECDIIVENTYTTPSVHQAYMEPHSALVLIDDEGRIQVWAPTKVPYNLRDQFAAAIGVPPEQIRVNPVQIGGDFGGKGSPMDVPVCYFLALKSGQPVKMTMNYVEEFTAANPRHASVIWLKTGVTNSGKLIAHQSRVYFNSGAYGGFKPSAGNGLPGGTSTGGYYKIPNTRFEMSQVYTNTVPGGFMRAPGQPQAFFAIESHLDEIAGVIGLTPLEIRLRNLIENGDESSTGEIIEDVRLRETVEAAVSAANQRPINEPFVGRGMAIGGWREGGGESHAAVTLSPDGSVVINTPTFEQGTGIYTILQQIVSEEIQIAPDHIHIEPWSTDGAPFDSGAGASRVTRIAGQAVHDAAVDARQKLCDLGQRFLGIDHDSILYTNGSVSDSSKTKSISWASLLESAGEIITGTGSVQDMARSPFASFTVQIADVKVDPETGEVQVLHFITAHDVGRVLNPIGHQGQINGGVVQGLGFALCEEIIISDGKVSNVTFADYKIPTIKDVPPLETILVEAPEGVGPYKIKGIGENTLGPVAPAIANAVANAIGARIRDLPITSEKIYQAMKST